MCFSVRYLARISVYDNSDQASFVLLGDAGRDLTGKEASELVQSYFEVITNLLTDNLSNCILICVLKFVRVMRAHVMIT